jgi:hypothetical protein
VDECFYLLRIFAKLVGQLDPPKAFLDVLSDANKERSRRELSKLATAGTFESIGHRGSKVIERAVPESLSPTQRSSY